MRNGIGTCEVWDSSFGRTSPLALKWYRSSKGFWEAELSHPGPAALLGPQILQGFLLLLLWTASAWTVPSWAKGCVLYVQIVFFYFSTSLHATNSAVSDFLKMGPTVIWSGKNYVFKLCYLFCCLFGWIKKESQVSCLFLCFWLMFPNVIWEMLRKHNFILISPEQHVIVRK